MIDVFTPKRISPDCPFKSNRGLTGRKSRDTLPLKRRRYQGKKNYNKKHSTTSRGPWFTPWPSCANTQYCTLYMKNAINKSIKKKILKK